MDYFLRSDQVPRLSHAAWTQHPTKTIVFHDSLVNTNNDAQLFEVPVVLLALIPVPPA
jgi:hypothetical protein